MTTLETIFDQNVKNYARSYFEYLNEISRKIDKAAIERFVLALLEARAAGTNIFFIGNGGSASTASHFANDLTIGTKSIDKPFRAISLNDNQALLTAIANDSGYEQVFAKQLMILSSKNDLVVPISASGNSPNLIEAINFAKKNQLKTFALTSFDGGKLSEISDDFIHVPANVGEYGPAEDVHLILNHLVVSYIWRHLSDGVFQS